MSKMLANGHDAEIFQNKDSSAQRWHLYERINDLFILIETSSISKKIQVEKCNKRFRILERGGIYATLSIVLIIGVLVGLGIISWEEIKPVIAAVKKVTP